MYSETTSNSIKSSLTKSLIGKDSKKPNVLFKEQLVSKQTRIETVDEEDCDSYERYNADNFSNIAMDEKDFDNSFYNDEMDDGYASLHDKENDDSNEMSTCSPLQAGSVNSSVLNLIACTVGAGTITMPYVIALTGIAFGSILIVLGAMLSHYSSSLLIKCN